jgi:hypothetical protein
MLPHQRHFRGFQREAVEAALDNAAASIIDDKPLMSVLTEGVMKLMRLDRRSAMPPLPALLEYFIKGRLRGYTEGPTRAANVLTRSVLMHLRLSQSSTCHRTRSDEAIQEVLDRLFSDDTVLELVATRVEKGRK